MKKNLIVLVLVTMVTALFPMVNVSAAVGAEIHVAVGGSDSADGTLSDPLATLDGARQKVREIKGTVGADEDILVLFHGGTYPISNTVNFDNNDSGVGTGKVIYKPYNNDEVSFKGSVSLDGSDFESVTDEGVIERILPETQGKVKQLDLQEAGLSSIYKYETAYSFIYALDTPGYPLLYVNDFEQSVAAWPNVGYTEFDEVVQDGDTGISGTPSQPYIIGYTGDRQDRWVTADEAMIDGFFRHDFAGEKKYISNVDPENKTFEINDLTNYGIEEGKRYRVINLLEELDVAGEFYVDRAAMMLYYYPPYDLNGASLELSVLPDTMVSIQNASNIEFSGMTFGKTLGRVFDIHHSDHITIAGNKILDVGQVGIYFSQSEDIIIQSNDIGHMGATGIFEHPNGDRTTLEHTNNKIINNRIFDTGKQLSTAGLGIMVIDVGSEVSNNILHNMPGLAIRYEGNDNLISHNEVYNVTRITSDTGAIYAGRRFNEFGNEIAYNFIHQGRSSVLEDAGLTVQGIYWDDQQSGQYAHHNVIHNYQRGLLMGGGLYNRFENNIIVDSTETMTVDNRGLNSNSTDPGGSIYDVLVSVPYDQEPYTTKYPELATILEDDPGPKYPHSNVIADNLYVNNTFSPYIEEEAITYAEDISNNHEVTADPGFIDAANKNFGIEPSSSILTDLPELADIDFDDIGLIEDQYRTEITPANLDFQLAYPLDGSTGLLTNDVVFSWDAAADADRYTLRIATDPEMEDVVHEEQVMYTRTLVNGLESGQATYYWTVEAENVSRQIGHQAMASGDPYTFTTTSFDILDKEELQETIDFAESTQSAIVEGTEVGQFVAGTKDQLQELLDEANDLNELELGRQNDVEEIIDEINDFIQRISQYINKGYIGIDHMLDPADWDVVNENSVTVEDGVLTIGDIGGSDTTTFMKEDMYGGTMLNFKMMPDFSDGWGLGFTLNQTGYPGLVWDGSLNSSGYLFLFKEDAFELQRYVDGQLTTFGSEYDPVIVEDNNSLIDEQWADIQVGAIDVNDGAAVKVILKVNGETIYDILDENPPSKLGGKFVFNNFAGPRGILVSNPDQLPTTDLMTDIGYPEAPEDNTPPLITLLGDDEVEVPLGSTFTDPGATAEDDIDGDITHEIIVSGTVDTNIVGTYVLTYNVSDASKNEAVPVTRTIEVVGNDYSVNNVSFNGIDGDELTKLPKKGFVMSSADITNNTSTAQSVNLVVVLYDKKGEIENLSGLIKEIPSGSTETFTGGFKMPGNNSGYYLKVFVTDSLTDVVPISNVAELRQK